MSENILKHSLKYQKKWETSKKCKPKAKDSTCERCDVKLLELGESYERVKKVKKNHFLHGSANPTIHLKSDLANIYHKTQRECILDRQHFYFQKLLVKKQ